MESINGLEERVNGAEDKVIGTAEKVNRTKERINGTQERIKIVKYDNKLIEERINILNKIINNEVFGIYLEDVIHLSRISINIILKINRGQLYGKKSGIKRTCCIEYLLMNIIWDINLIFNRAHI